MRRDDDVEAPALRDEDVALIAKVRALPAEGEEPRWRELEAAIRAQVSSLPMPAPWWRNWRWLVPIGALATTAAIVAVVTMRRSDDDHGARSVSIRDDASVPVASEQRDTGEESRTERMERAPAVWLDGESVELDEATSPDAIDTVGAIGAADALALPDETEPAIGSAEDVDDSMLPMTDYRWLDALDDDAVARVETFLARKRS
jgi:hypothetical protein